MIIMAESGSPLAEVLQRKLPWKSETFFIFTLLWTFSPPYDNEDKQRKDTVWRNFLSLLSFGKDSFF